MLTVRDLNAFYGRAQVLFGIDFQVEQGEAVALMGRNGAGKSTTLKCIMGLVQSSAAELSFQGHDLRRRDAFRINRLGIGYVAEERRIFTDLTVAENLEVGRRPTDNGAGEWSPEELFSLFPNLAGMKNRRAAHISGGEQQMLAIARTLMGNPRFLLLDEPSEGLAPMIVTQMAETIGKLKDRGVTLILSEQNPRFARSIADRVIVIETGRIAWQGTMEAFEADRDAQNRFLSA
ncbi:MAG: ABC transporter ATP-binding protein [Rhodospirillales bacterium]|nr:ABC transporter ATP-binding protein [Rhodospirillales bacterium]